MIHVVPPLANFIRRHAFWVPVLVVASAAIAIALAGPDTQASLRYERYAILDMEWWRLLTGNLVHLSTAHLALNLAGLGLISFLFRSRFDAWRWFAVLLACALSTSLGLLIFTQVEWYVGLSGVLHGAYAAGALAEVRDGRRFGYVLLSLLSVKLLAELLLGPSASTAALIGGEVVVDAHLFGALGGFLSLVLRPPAALRS